MTPLAKQLADELARWEGAGLRRELNLPAGIDFTTNNYLGLARDVRVIAAARDALETYGAGAAAARLLSGHLPVHAQAEQAAAEWLGTEAALLFASGWQANQAVITTFAGADDVLFSDSLNHASIIDGARLARAAVEVFAHNDMADLERRLEAHSGARRRLIAVESVYSMDGDLAPLPELLALAQAHDAYLFVDHAHGAGVYADRYLSSERVLAQMITGGKGLGVCGGFVCASQTAIDLLFNRGRSFVFSTAVTPATAGALVAAIAIARSEPERRTRLHDLTRRLREGLRGGGLDVPGEGPIVSVVLGDERRALDVAAQVRLEGFDVRAVRPPTVPPGTSRLRIVCHADHTPEQVDRLAAAVVEAVGQHPAVASAVSIPAQSRALVVCGTDTEVGKTVVSALLVRSCLRRGEAVRYLKPVQTGDDSDTRTVTRLSELPASLVLDPVVELPLPASVDQAAEEAGVEVTVEQVFQGVSARLGDDLNSRWIVECAGGLLVPYSDTEDQSDLLVRLGAPLLLVARSGLGTLNHTLLTLEAFKRRGLRVSALVLVGDSHARNLKTLRQRLGALPIFELPHLGALDTDVLDEWLGNNPRFGEER